MKKKAILNNNNKVAFTQRNFKKSHGIKNSIENDQIITARPSSKTAKKINKNDNNQKKTKSNKKSKSISQQHLIKVENKFLITPNENILQNQRSFLVLESFLKEYQIKPVSLFILYLSDIWRELSIFSPEPNKGISRIIYSRFFPLPGLISKRLFDVLDNNKDGFISAKDFIEGLCILFCEEIFSLLKFIFVFYDFDNDDFITSEDIHAIMSYIPVINSFSDMVDIEEEICDTLFEIFGDEKKKMSLYEFTDLVINKERYEIFIPIISFFYEQKLFTNEQINIFYSHISDGKNDNINNVVNTYHIKNKIKLKVYGELNDDEINNENNEEKKLNELFFKENQIINDNKNNVITHTDENENITNENNNNIITNNDENDENENNTNENIENEEIVENKMIDDNDVFGNSDSFDKNQETLVFAIEEKETESRKKSSVDSNDSNNENKDNNLISCSKKNDNKNSVSSCLIKKDLFSNKKKVIFDDAKNKKELTTFYNKINEHDNDTTKNKKKSFNLINEKDANSSNYVNKIKPVERPLIHKRFQSTGNFAIQQQIKMKIIKSSPGFKFLQKSIPSLINNTKILSQYSLNKNKKQNKKNILKDICQSKIVNDDNENEYVNKLKTENNRINTEKKENKIKYESYLYKITPNSKRLKKMYFKLFNKDLYFYKNEKSTIHKGMHNLSNYYLEINDDDDEEEESFHSEQPEKNNKNTSNNSSNKSNIESSNLSINKQNLSEIKKTIINGIEYYSFLLINQRRKTQLYLTPDIYTYYDWVKELKNAMNFKDLNEQYEFIEFIGKGKFSQVFSALDIKNNRTVAIKHINKTNLKFVDLELIKNEIDILKICQHPYVVGLYDVIETYNTIDIILEYCKGGNLYRYFIKKNFKISEKQIVTYIHNISKAVYSMHNLGIIHLDLKLSNIAMISEDDENEIRILDFGLSKIIGPGETCTESYGTPGYAAPEVINEEPYRFKADVWSIGAIAYFMCSTKLPFDYITEGLNEKNIVLNTVNDELKFNESCWKKYSKEAVNFIKSTMNKDVNKRLSIKQVLEHEWIKKYFYDEVRKRKASCSLNFSLSDTNIKRLDKKSGNGGMVRSHSNYSLYAATGSVEMK